MGRGDEPGMKFVGEEGSWDNNSSSANNFTMGGGGGGGG